MGSERSQIARNQDGIRGITAGASSDLDTLARLFEDDRIEDDGTVAGRATALFEATERALIPGLQTALPFSDSGFAGNRDRGGAGFRDPWPSSRNQVGHFLTAVRLSLAPDVVHQSIPILGSIRAIVGAPREMGDSEVALRLTIGHEKAPDPRDALPAALRVLASGLSLGGVAAVADAGRRASVGTAVIALVAASAWQARVILGGFRRQFSATSEADLAAWQEALRVVGPGTPLGRRAVDGAESPLLAIDVGDGVGNSGQDLRLSLVGWRLGQLIGDGAFADRRAIGPWLREALGPCEDGGRGDDEHADRRISRQKPGSRPAWIALVRRVADSPLTGATISAATRILPEPRVALTHYEVPVRNLPHQRDGLRILHLSDLHVHPGSGLAWQLPELLEGVEYDLLCYTGDFIDIDIDIPNLQRLLARMPVANAYAVLGNHDYIPFGREGSRESNDSARLRAVLADAGIRVLVNEALPVCDGNMMLVGVDDPDTGRDDIDRAFAGVQEGAATLLLAHSPDIVLRLGAHRPGLILAGHTHGGQVRLPLIGTPVTMSKVPNGLIKGLVSYEEVPMFVSRGVGYSGLNIRIGSPSEAALLTLRAMR